MEPKRNWWSILFGVAFACVAVFMSVKSSIISIDTYPNQKPNSAQTTTVPADRQDEPLYEEAFAANLRKQDAQKIFTYLKEHETLDVIWTASGGDERMALASRHDEIKNGFAVGTALNTTAKNGTDGVVYDVLMVDENADGVLDHIIYTNEQDRSDEHIYHNPTDGASLAMWDFSLRELAKAAR